MKRDKKPAIIIITGAESTGKTLLTRQLSRQLGAPAFMEFAREYITGLHRPYHYSDIESIARMQQAQMKSALSMNQDLVLFDTWLIITMVWFEVVYGKVPGWIVETIANTPVDLFLVCDTDLPWVPDPVRENGGEMRDRLESRYMELIREFGFPFRVVSGTGEKRLLSGAHFIGSMGYNL
jgi:nicotinamide riboside kinase